MKCLLLLCYPRLIQYFDVRKAARTSEIDALGKAKAVLSGADFSLMQTSSRKFLQ